MSPDTDIADQRLQAGRAAFEDGRWTEALESLRAADEAGGLDAEDLRRLGEAAWWNAELDTAIAARERAFARFSREGRSLEAARIAVELASDYLNQVRMPLVRAFMGRAERLLADEPESPVHGLVAIMQAAFALERGDAEEAMRLADGASGIARRFADRDLEGMALLWRARALIVRGDVAEGLELLDEAAGTALIGDLSPQTTGLVYCWTISACADLADYERASDWTDVALRWCERHASTSGFPGVCRVHQAEILRFKGDWPLAEQAAMRATQELDQVSAVAAQAWYEVGEVRLRTGETAAAEEAFARAHELGREPQPGLALLRLAQGRADSALAAIRRALDEPGMPPLARSKLLPAHVEAALAVGRLDEARDAAAQLAEIAETYRTPGTMLEAVAECALGQVALAAGDAVEAGQRLRTALRIWLALHSPYEAARTRLLLASVAEQAGDTDGAVMELRSAQAVFERLGAGPDARAAAERSERLRADVHGGVGEHAVRTFMFTDIVDSTPLVEVIGDDAWTDLVRWHDVLLRGLFAAGNGEEVDHAGDGFLVAFPDAGSAMDCAVDIQRQLAEHRRSHGFAPPVRIGLHQASAVADGLTYRGRGVHEAARIASLAGAGSVVASAATAEAAGRPYPLSSPRDTTLKGIAEPVPVVTVDWS